MKTLLLTAIFATNLASASEPKKVELSREELRIPLSSEDLKPDRRIEVERISPAEVERRLRISTGGGNGGDLSTINASATAREFTRIRNELAGFLSSPTARTIFKDVDLEETIKILSNDETFSFVQTKLKDRFEIERDALNYPDELKVFINQESFEAAITTKAIYILVLHEVFGLQNVETNNANSTADAYRESLKLWNYIHAEEIYSLREKKVDTEEGLYCEVGSDKRSVGIQIKKSSARMFSHYYFENLLDAYNRLAANWRGYEVQTSQHHSVFYGKNVNLQKNGEKIVKASFGTLEQEYQIEIDAMFGSRYSITVIDPSGKRYYTHAMCSQLKFLSSARYPFRIEANGEGYLAIDSIHIDQTKKKSLKYMNRNLRKLFDR